MGAFSATVTVMCLTLFWLYQSEKFLAQAGLVIVYCSLVGQQNPDSRSGILKLLKDKGISLENPTDQSVGQAEKRLYVASQ